MPIRDPHLRWIADTCGAAEASPGERIQSLWSGYGEIRRVHLRGGPSASVIMKWIRPPTHVGAGQHAHQRKLRSYEVERHFYEQYSAQTHPGCRVPRYLGSASVDGGRAFLLEDLDPAGFSRRFEGTPHQIEAALNWLAAFHATFMHVTPDGLWPEGTYWHLETRPDELAAMTDRRLREAAPQLDARLQGARFRTLVHGDAKVCNLCFTPDGRAAAVDFQYVGGGCGMKDLAYLLSSSLSERALQRTGADLVDRYFQALRRALSDRPVDLDALEREWRSLYPIAWADFARFLSGWAAGWSAGGYTADQVDAALLSLGSGCT